jgi:hypothetical protein
VHCTRYILWLFGAVLLVGEVQSAQQEIAPPIPPLVSPIKRFREWLAMPEAERHKAIAEYPEEKRKILEAKVQQYAKLPEAERDRRLRAVELRWYLRPLMGLPAEKRKMTLEAIPTEYKQLVEQRLQQWDQLNPALKKQLLESELTIQYVTRVQQRVLTPPTPASSEAIQQAQQAARQFNLFFQLPPAEKEKTLNALSESERREMEKTLRAFEQLPLAQRHLCMQSFEKFATMAADEKRDFLKSAARWQSMSPQDRALWRQLVANLPPLPPAGPDLPPIPRAGAPNGPRTASNNAPGVPIN